MKLLIFLIVMSSSSLIISVLCANHLWKVNKLVRMYEHEVQAWRKLALEYHEHAVKDALYRFSEWVRQERAKQKYWDKIREAQERAGEDADRREEETRG